MKKFTATMIMVFVAVTTSMVFASESTVVRKKAVAVSSNGNPAAVAVAGTGKTAAVAIAGPVDQKDVVVETKTEKAPEKAPKDVSVSSDTDTREEKKPEPQKTETKPAKSRRPAAVAIASSGAAAAASASGGSVTYYTSTGNGRAVAAVSEGGFIGVSSVSGKKPKVYTSQEAMSQDMDYESSPEMGFLQRLLDILGL